MDYKIDFYKGINRNINHLTINFAVSNLEILFLRSKLFIGLIGS